MRPHPSPLTQIEDNAMILLPSDKKNITSDNSLGKYSSSLVLGQRTPANISIAYRGSVAIDSQSDGGDIHQGKEMKCFR